MKRITKKVLPISLALAISFSANISHSADFEPSSYINTAFGINLCGPGSSLTSCLDPVILGTSSVGTSFDLQSINSGESAGQMGNLSKAVVGTTYSFAQVVLSRAFTVTGQAAAAGGNARCRTRANNDFNNTSGNEAAVVAANDTAVAVPQIMGIPDTTGLGTHMQGTTSTDGINGADNATLGKIQAGEPNVKFRFELTKPITIKSGKLPTFTIAFDLGEAIEFNTVSGTACVVTPGSPVVTATFSN